MSFIFRRFKILLEVWRFARDSRKIWMSLLILFLLLVGLVILLTESAAVMPFIYTLF